MSALSWLDTLKGKHRQVFAAGVGGPVNALGGHANRIAREMHLDANQVRDDLVAGLNSGVKLVPAHTMALGLAQEHGFTYEQLG